MEKKTYYVSIGYCGALVRTPGNRKYGPGIKGRANNVVPITCTEDDLVEIATAVGRGLLADSCTIALTESDAWDAYVVPYKVLWDCM
jgi:hypothetical protein